MTGRLRVALREGPFCEGNCVPAAWCKNSPNQGRAALTQMDLYPDYPEWAVQQDTAVIPAYRGKRLARWVKAHMLRALLAERPSIGKIYTNVNADNEYMIRVNEHQERNVVERHSTALNGG